MPKSEYTIDGRQFRMERNGVGWRGWFVDDPDHRFTGRLKMDVLCGAGYGIPVSGSGSLIIQASESTGLRRYTPSGGMRRAYAEYRQKLAQGHRPRIRDDRPLSKFHIFARDDFRCFYCGCSTDAPTIDHVCPRECGGPDIAGNIATCCGPCNSRKGHSRLPDEIERLAELARRNAGYGMRNEHLVRDAAVLDSDAPLPPLSRR